MSTHRTARLRLGVAAALTSIALVATGCSSEPAEPGTTSFSGHRIEGDNRYTPSTLQLTDTSGTARALGDGDADLTLVFFGYTHCPDICGIVMSNVASAVNRLDDSQKDRLEMVFVTTDPARDDEKTLRTYLDRYNPEFEGLTGDLDDVIEVATSMKVAIEEGQKLPSGGYEVAHGDQVFGLDTEHRGAVVWTKETSSAEMAADITQLLGS